MKVLLGDYLITYKVGNHTFTGSFPYDGTKKSREEPPEDQFAKIDKPVPKQTYRGSPFDSKMDDPIEAEEAKKEEEKEP
jgi:hypothetical protein